jgi:hypothetical protein
MYVIFVSHQCHQKQGISVFYFFLKRQGSGGINTP